MPHPNSLAGTCYLCARYVGIGKGQLLKNHTASGSLVANGHRHVVRCASCSQPRPVAAAAPTARPTEASMSAAALRVCQQSLRKSLLALLADADMPAEYVRPGQEWLEAKLRPLDALYAFKDRLLALLQEHRERNDRAPQAA